MRDMVLGVTGASGMRYAHSVLLMTANSQIHWHLIISDNARNIAGSELDKGGADALTRYAHRVYANDDMAAKVASGSSTIDAMLLLPCSVNTLSKVACGIQDNLITRSAAVMLKEKKRLVMVFREAPISSIIARNIHELTLAGAVVMPAAPGFYTKPKDIDELVGHFSGRILDQLGIPHDMPRWDETK